MTAQRGGAMRPSLVAALAIAAALLGACATVPRGEADGAGEATQNDPLEPLNRDIFAVNQAIDRAVIKPVAEAYRAVLPEVLRDHVRLIIDNLHEPLVLVNNVLQGRGDAAGISVRRFLINSTLGLGGIFDRAQSDFGLARQTGDFGQTLYAWGFESGPYLMLPLLGPSNVRDVVGLGFDAYASPVSHIGSDQVRREVSISSGVADGLDLRSRNIESLESLEANSLDFYAYLRSVSRQNRNATLRDVRPQAPDANEDLVDPGAAPPSSTAPAAEPQTPSQQLPVPDAAPH